MQVVDKLIGMHKEQLQRRPNASTPAGPTATALVLRRARHGGVTLVELIVVIGVLALAGAIALPPFLDWRHGMRLRAAANEVRSDLERARARAIKENTDVVVQFEPTTGLYRMTYSDEAGTVVLIKSASLPPGIRIATENAAYTLDSFGNQALFGSRGTARAATLVLANPKGSTRQIVINYLGRIDLRN